MTAVLNAIIKRLVGTDISWKGKLYKNECAEKPIIEPNAKKII